MSALQQTAPTSNYNSAHQKEPPMIDTLIQILLGILMFIGISVGVIVALVLLAVLIALAFGIKNMKFTASTKKDEEDDK